MVQPPTAFSRDLSAAGSTTGRSLHDLFANRRTTAPHAQLLHADGRWWSAQELGRRSDEFARALVAAGASPGVPVAFVLDNSADFVAALFATARIGAIAVTLNTALGEEGLGSLLAHCGAPIVVAEAEHADRVSQAVRATPGVAELWVRGVHASAGTDLDEVLAKAAPHPVPDVHRRADGDPAAVLYTSGTTGRPKGVELTDGGYVVASDWFVRAFGLCASDVLQTSLPLFHINAQQLSLCGALRCGGTLVLERRFSARSFWTSVAKHGVTQFNLIGAMLGILHAAPPTTAERAHQVRIACVAPTPASIHRECEERFGVELIDGYGLTETTPGVTYNPRGAGREGSCGTAAPHVQLRIVAPDGHVAASGEAGEIQLRPLIPDVFMRGYLEDPQATAEAFEGDWFKTGDRGRLDADGYLFFVDRIKDVIRRRGENIAASEIERVALQHPAVREAAAVGVPSDLVGGEDEVAIFAIADDLAPSELAGFCAARLPSFMHPRYVQLVDNFPRTETQRVRKVALREVGVEAAFDRLARS